MARLIYAASNFVLKMEMVGSSETLAPLSQTASYLRRLMSDYQLTNSCVGWYDGSTDNSHQCEATIHTF